MPRRHLDTQVPFIKGLTHISRLANIRNQRANFYRNMYIDNIGRYKGNTNIPITKEYTLPNIVIKPNDNTLRHIKEMFPDEDLRYDFYKQTFGLISEREKAKRLYQLYKAAGKPVIRRTAPHNLLANIVGDKRNRDRASYNYITNTIYNPKNTFNDYIAELSHALAYNDNNLKASNLKENMFSTLHDIIRYGTGDAKYGNYDNYANPNHYEHKAHSIIENAINKYLCPVVTDVERKRGLKDTSSFYDFASYKATRK